MDYIKWNDELSVNILTIDNQHKKLIEELNRFYDGLGKRRNKEGMSDILYQLKQYSIYHFQTEEELMRKYSFKGYLAHKKEHDEFIAKIDTLQNKLDEGKLLLTIELTGFMKDWLSNHILKTDKAYSQFLNDCGIK